MTDDLLSQEKEFRRINKELDKKTSEILKEADLIVNNNNNNNSINNLTTKKWFSGGFSRFHSRSPTNFDTYNSIESTQIDSNFLDNFYKNNDNNIKLTDNSTILCTLESAADPTNSIRSEEKKLLLDDDTIFSSLNNNNNNSTKSNETIIKFLKAKIEVLASDLNITRDELKKKDNFIKDLQIENKKINEFKDKLNNQIINLKSTISKLEGSITSQQTELQVRCNENNSLKKDLESAKREYKNINQQMNNLDLRLNRSLEDNEKLKSTIKRYKIDEKNLRDKIRKLEEGERLIVKNYERQLAELLQAFKKQSLLIDNLKKQKALLEASKHVELTRDEFLKILKTEI